MNYEDYSLAQIGEALHHIRANTYEGNEQALLDELKGRFCKGKGLDFSTKHFYSYHVSAFAKEPTAERFLQLYVMMCLVQEIAPIREDAR
jgi:hypothetical protein